MSRPHCRHPLDPLSEPPGRATAVVETDGDGKWELRALERFKPLLTEEEDRLTEQVRDGDPAALARLTEAKQRLAYLVAVRYVYAGIPLSDLIAEVNLALIAAIRTFDPAGKVRLSYWARARTVRRIELAVSIGRRNSTPCPMALDVAPSSDEPRAAAGSKLHRFNVHSVDDVLAARALPPIEDQLFAEQLRLFVDRLLLELEEREARLLADRFGLQGHESQTVKDLAARRGISADTTQVAIDRALWRLRNRFQDEGWTAEALLCP